MHELHIDLETYSSADLSHCGVYRYTEAPDFAVLLFGYSIDGGPVSVVDLASGEPLPEEIRQALTDDSVIKIAHNSHFERICLSRFLGYPTGQYLNPSGWHCTMIWAACLGLPLSLAEVGSVLGLEKQKLETGKDLIRYFCMPCAPTLSNGGRIRNLPQDAPEKWAQFVSYNKRDVETELEIQQRLSYYPVPEEIWAEYHLDQRINDRGVGADMTLVRQAIRMDELSKQELSAELKDLTGLDHPNSISQLEAWLAERGIRTDSLGKKDVNALMQDCAEPLRRVLTLHQQLAKSSVRKYQAILQAVSEDGRVRGCFQFYGANRTGRFAGRIVQLQNLPQNHLEDLAEARELVRSGDYAAVKARYGNVPDILSQLIRTAFIPGADKRYLVADFSAIEARVLSWLAEETWRTEVFASGKDIYCASATQMFGVPVEKHGINAHLRQKGKIAELALGYGGSVGALKAMGALEMGLKEEELNDLVSAWRKANPRIVSFWWEIGRAALTAVRKRTSLLCHGLVFSYQPDFLFITLPSGRKLAYLKPRIGKNRFGSESLSYEGTGSTKKWERLETYGPKLTENIVQGISRDLLCHAMKALEHTELCMHIHDEVILEAPQDMEVREICDIMSRSPDWAEGLILNADGFAAPWYRKD